MKRTFLLFLGSLLCLATNAQTEMKHELSDTDSTDMIALYKQMNEVTVQAERPIVRMERGRLSYDMPTLLKRIPADNAYDALRNIPGIMASEGSLSVANRPVTLIINGKATTLNQEEAVERLKAMPAERLARAEVMLSAPPQLHVRGAVINVITRESKGETSGQLQGMLSQSKHTRGNATGNLLIVRNKLTLDLNYGYTLGKNYGEVKHTALHPLDGQRIAYYDKTAGTVSGYRHNWRAGIDYQIGKAHSLSLAYTGNHNDTDKENHATGTTVAHQLSTHKNQLHNIDPTYQLPFGLQLSANYLHYRSPQEQHLDTDAQDNSRDLTAHSNQTIHKWLYTADQSHALPKGWGLNYGGKVQLTSNSSYQTTRDAEGNALPEATSQVDLHERIASIYVGGSKEIAKNLSMDASLTLENFHNARWNKWRVYPTLNAMWRIKPLHMLSLSLSSDAKYPSYWSTMSTVYYSSAYSEIWGNPNLKPSNDYGIYLTYQLRHRYSFTAFAEMKPNWFVQLPYQPSDRMAVIMQEVNFNHRNTYGIQASAQFRAGRWLNGNAFVVGMLTDDRNDAFHDIPFHRRHLSAVVGGTASIQPWQRTNLRLILSPTYQSSAIQGVYDIRAMFSLNASLRWASKDNQWSIVASGNNLTNRSMQTSDTWRNQHFIMDVCQDWISGSLSVVYRFGNYKQKQQKKIDTSRLR